MHQSTEHINYTLVYILKTPGKDNFDGNKNKICSREQAITFLNKLQLKNISSNIFIIG